MEDKIDRAIDNVLTHSFRAGAVPKPDDALKLSQTILNLTHAKNVHLAARELLEGKPKKQGAAA